MLLWFVGGSVVAVWAVFHDPAFDYRLVAVGALLPDVIDVWTGGAWLGHTLLLSVALLVGVMLGTRKRRRLRRRLLALPIGMFLHLVLDGMWSVREVFWWPAFGWSFGDTAVPSLDRPWPVVVVLEAAGLAALVWCWRRFGLADPERRWLLVRTGRLDRSLAES